MASFGLAEAAQAIRERIGRDARYSYYTPPRVRNAHRHRRWERILLATALFLLLAVLVLAALVALGI
jgi:hypothetical protein